MGQIFPMNNAGIQIAGMQFQPYDITITADTNDLAITDTSVDVISSNLRLNNTSGLSKNITGIVSDGDGHFLMILNYSANNIVLTNQDAGSAAANRFINIGGVNKTLSQYGFAIYQYVTSGSINRWIQII